MQLHTNEIWFFRLLIFNLQDLRKALEEGREPGVPDGVLFNGLGSFQYNKSIIRDGIGYERINVEQGNVC